MLPETYRLEITTKDVQGLQRAIGLLAEFDEATKSFERKSKEDVQWLHKVTKYFAGRNRNGKASADT